jgi:hypothetical protein
MLSPKFLRFLAQKCLRTAHAANDLKTVIELKAMARDLICWAHEAEIEATPNTISPSP